jgi:hypothetical protein
LHRLTNAIGALAALFGVVNNYLPLAGHESHVERQKHQGRGHGGIHPLHRQAEGFPVHLALQIPRNSNGLLTMTGMALPILVGNATVAKSMIKIQSDFADCLPDLLK